MTLIKEKYNLLCVIYAFLFVPEHMEQEEDRTPIRALHNIILTYVSWLSRASLGVRERSARGLIFFCLFCAVSLCKHCFLINQ